MGSLVQAVAGIAEVAQTAGWLGIVVAWEVRKAKVAEETGAGFVAAGMADLVENTAVDTDLREQLHTASGPDRTLANQRVVAIVKVRV